MNSGMMEDRVADYDPIRALREEISGLADVHKIVQSRTRRSEAAMAEAEAEHNASLKMDAFLSGILDGMRERLKKLETEAEIRAKG